MKKKLKFLLLALGGFIVLMVLGLAITGWVMNKPLPEGKSGPEAEALADEMLAAINIEAWDDLALLQWEFPGGYRYFWSKKENFVEVKWENMRVLLNPETRSGKVYADGKIMENGEKKEEMLQHAFHRFANDSFWLVAFTKVRDPGTERKLVELEDGNRGLMITYSSGGVTPGDSYLWILDENGRPLAWQMWVEIIPVGGLRLGWSPWEKLYNGAMVAPVHLGSVFDLVLTDVKAGTNIAEFGYDVDPFLALED